MKNKLFKYSKVLFTGVSIAVVFSSCNKKDIVVDFNYPATTVGLAQAAVATVGPGANAVYTITPNVYGRGGRYIPDVAASKFNIPLGVLRSAVDASGSITVNLAAATDTVTKMITAGKLVAGTELLPASAYSLPATVTIEDGALNAAFTLAIDLNFLATNITKKYAIGLLISASKTDIINPKLSTVVIYIDVTNVLTPISNFSNSLEAVYKKVNFVNLSSNGISYLWNYGDGSPVETTASPSHTYTAAGSYTISLTTTGVAGVPSVKTITVVIP